MLFKVLRLCTGLKNLFVIVFPTRMTTRQLFKSLIVCGNVKCINLYIQQDIFLNSGVFYKDIVGVACEEVEQGLYGCIMRLVPEQEPVCGHHMDLRHLILNFLPYESSLHTKKQNRLVQSRLYDMVFVKFNHGLGRRVKHKEKDPNILQKIDESNEWLMGRLEEENDDDIILFGEMRDVAHASGAYESSYLTRASRAQNDGARPSGIDKRKALESKVEEDIGSECGGDDVVQVNDDDDHFAFF
uniref:Uncharacterized protein n=1 Tax=Lactuca sativa TaxID=4236 RepID=A0A9R1V981_LACSA|nr:hypothetical protein LSAT_V11C600316160 [Lactuca sativa]